MHELSIAMSIVEIAGEELQRHGGGAIIAVHLKLGPLAGVVKQALTSAFELAREGSSVERATLLIEDVPIVGFCRRCRAQRAATSLLDLCCGQCGAYLSDIAGGRELEIVALEIES
jgi:hydrogenase nickel incorporation protein HypA/HybF